MKKWIVLLCGLLAAQLILAVVIYLSGDEYSVYKADEKLLVFDTKAVDHILIEDDSSRVVLAKQEEKWVLPEYDDFPTDQQNVLQLLDKLASMKKGWPVATTSGASRRFKVAEDEYERKLTLLTEKEPLVQLYMGTSPGLRKMHVRNAHEEEVFAVAFNTWEAGASADDWLDKNILAFSAEELLRVEMPDFVLQHENDEFHLVDLADQEEINEPEIQLLINRLSQLQVDSLLNGSDKPEDLPGEADFKLLVTLKPDETLTYHFFKPNEEPYYLLKHSNFDDYFKIAEFHVNAIKETTRDKLLLTNAEEGPGDITENETLDSDVEFID